MYCGQNMRLLVKHQLQQSETAMILDKSSNLPKCGLPYRSYGHRLLQTLNAPGHWKIYNHAWEPSWHLIYVLCFPSSPVLARLKSELSLCLTRSPKTFPPKNLTLGAGRDHFMLEESVTCNLKRRCCSSLGNCSVVKWRQLLFRAFCNLCFVGIYQYPPWVPLSGAGVCAQSACVAAYLPLTGGPHPVNTTPQSCPSHDNKSPNFL